MVFTEFGDDRHAGLEALRSERILHPAVRVLRFWREGPPIEAISAAAGRPLLGAPQPLPDGEKTIQSRGGHVGEVCVHLAGALRQRYLYYPGGGALRVYEAFGHDGALELRWRCDLDGRVVTVDSFSRGAGNIMHRSFVALGRAIWLSADMRAGEGTGPAETPLSPPPPSPSLAGAIADWLDRRFADCPELVVMADGENVSQNVIRAMRHPGIRAVSILHNCHTVSPHTGEAPTRENWRPFFEKSDRPPLTVCLTSRQKRDLEARYPHLNAEVAHHAAPQARRAKVRRDPNRLVFVGRLSEQKRLSDMIAAFALVAGAVPKARLDIWGDGAERRALEAEIARRGLAGRVKLKGFTRRPDLAFAGAAATVMTSLYEGFPLTLLEAMSVGTPFVAYDINYGPAEVIRDGVDGFLTPVGDVDTLAQRLITLLSDRALQARMQQEALKVSERFSGERYTRRWLEILDIACGLRDERGSQGSVAAAAREDTHVV